MTITAAQALARYGDPHDYQRRLVMLNIPSEHQVGALPRHVYCHSEIAPRLLRAFGTIAQEGWGSLIKTWDGCFNIRPQRRGVAQSLHSWGLAIDCNAATNVLGRPPTMDARIVTAFESAGFEWGGRWYRPDGMHFQLARLPE